jgi:uncharacterized ferritin-like protein (DUF455 family)
MRGLQCFPVVFRAMASVAAKPLGVPADIFDAANQIMTEPDVDRKACMSFEFARLFQEGGLPVWNAPFRATAGHPTAPTEPARPGHVAVVDPRRTAGGKSVKAMLHALVHAESYAIDLSWDILLRFGAQPSTWHVGEPRCDSATVTASGGASAPCGSGAAEPLLLPHDFFADWTRVAAEEAKHFALWRDRLQELGCAYGDFPAHDGLWESAEKTAHSLPARLAVVHMIHEARGLDTYLAARDRLQRCGDKAAVAIIEANHKEEIGHVATGLRWLSYLCEARPGESAATTAPSACGTAAVEPLDPKAVYVSLVRAHFCGAVKPPFNTASRDAAGLTLDWYAPLMHRPLGPTDGADAVVAAAVPAAVAEAKEEES